MLSLAHTLVSLPFAYSLDHPLLIFVAALLFHIICDTLLHWNVFPETTGQYFLPLGAVDAALGLLAAWLLVGPDLLTWPVLLAIAGGNLPDVLQQGWNMLGASRQQRYLAWAAAPFMFHEDIQYETTHIVPGMVSQVVLITAAVGLVLLAKT